MPIHTQEIAEKILKDNLLYLETLSLIDLFCIRDHCLGLAKYNLEDKAFLEETLKFIQQKGE